MLIIPVFRRAQALVWTSLCLCALVFPTAASAQDPLIGQGMTPEQIRELLRTQPALAEQLRQRLGSSGMTSDQVRTRLRASGYPENLFDEYMTDGDISRAGVTPNTIDAARELGLLSDGEADTSRAAMNAKAPDSLKAESTRPRPAPALERFGLKVFTTQSSQFEANQAGPVDENYRLGPGDRIALILSGDVQAAYSLEVGREGMLLIPQVGQVFAANLTLGQLEDVLYRRLGQVYSGLRRSPNAATQMSLTVTRLRNVQVLVAGEVARPGAFQVSAAGTVLTALYAAGGPTANGNFRRVEIRRGGKLVDSADLNSYLLSGENASSVRLQSGDVLFVPVHGPLVKVTGRVVRPAIYEIKPNETLRDVLLAAGGLEANALQQRVQIHRILPPDPRQPGRARVVIDIGAEQFAGGVVPAVPMSAGDSVTVFEVAERVRGYVTVKGNVWTPGVVGYQPGLKLSEAIRLAGGAKPDVYLGQVLVSRLNPDSTRSQLRTSFADSSGRLTNDLALVEEDEVQIFATSTFRAEMYVVVSGAVRKPGRIRYREGMTVRDAILLADGLSQGAYLKEAEIARVPEDTVRGTVATTIRVPLDSTFIFDRVGSAEMRGPRGVPVPASGAPEVELRPYDNLLILRQPGWELPQSVSITGQVRYPGPYAIRTRTERLSDLIQRAGGLTAQAYTGGVEYWRRQDSAGRIGVNLPAVLKDPKHRDNYVLVAGDSVNIPEFNPVVMVTGAVNAPGAVAFSPNRTIDYYIRSAGGLGPGGDKNRAFVTQPNGQRATVQRRFLLPDNGPVVRPGARVTVPTRDPTQGASQIPVILGVMAQVLASLVTIIVVARN
jgi:polysaccharide biosynthesis/export protein